MTLFQFVIILLKSKFDVILDSIVLFILNLRKDLFILPILRQIKFLI